jgi:hypothetical protein
MGGGYIMLNRTIFLYENFNGITSLDDKILLKLILKKYRVRVRTGPNWSQRPSICPL